MCKDDMKGCLKISFHYPVFLSYFIQPSSPFKYTLFVNFFSFPFKYDRFVSALSACDLFVVVVASMCHYLHNMAAYFAIEFTHHNSLLHRTQPFFLLNRSFCSLFFLSFLFSGAVYFPFLFLFFFFFAFRRHLILKSNLSYRLIRMCLLLLLSA